MKYIHSLIFILIFGIQLYAQQSPWDKKLPFRNMTINYTIDGTMDGSKILYIKDYGRTTAEYKETIISIFGMKKEEKELIIITPDWEYHIDILNNSGTKQISMNKLLTQEFNRLSQVKQKKVISKANSIGYSTLKSMDGKIQRNSKKIFGYQCDKIDMMGTIMYTMKDTEIPLETKSNMMGIKMNEIATKIIQGSISESKFKVPEIDFIHNIENDEMMKLQATTIINNLLNEKSNHSRKSKPRIQNNSNDKNIKDDNSDIEMLQKEGKKQFNKLMQIFGN